MTDNSESNNSWLATLSQELAVEAELDGRILKVNSVWTRILGWSDIEMLSRNFFELIHPEDRENIRQEIMRAPAGTAPLHFGTRYCHKDGSYRWISWNAAANGNILYATGLDRTDQIVTSRESEEELYRMQKMQTVGRMSGHVAHEFNNFLQGIVASLELVRKLIDLGRAGETGRFIEKAIASAHRAASLNERVQSFARQQHREPKPLVMGTVISNMEQMLRSALPQTTKLALDLSENSWATCCDTNQAENAILELTLNARDAMPNGGTISLRASDADIEKRGPRADESLAPGQYVCIAVTATASSMTTGMASTPRAVRPAAGLPIAAVHNFAKRNKGSVQSESQVGASISIRLYLPRYQGLQPQDANRKSALG